MDLSGNAIVVGGGTYFPRDTIWSIRPRIFHLSCLPYLPPSLLPYAPDKGLHNELISCRYYMHTSLPHRDYMH